MIMMMGLLRCAARRVLIKLIDRARPCRPGSRAGRGRSSIYKLAAYACSKRRKEIEINSLACYLFARPYREARPADRHASLDDASIEN
jgi:hypothetical protein